VTAVVRRENAEHYVWGAGADGFRRVHRADLSVVEERMPPGARETRHRHARARQCFFVCEGELEIECEGVVHALVRGDSLEVAPGVVHEVRNAARADAWFLVVSAPSSVGDREDCG
jgi:quercetin dioxygenase-like cupin family protein